MTPTSLQHGRRLSPRQRALCRDIAMARAAGESTVSIAALARMLKCHRDTIYYWLAREDVAGRPPGPAPGTLRRPLPDGPAQDAQTWRTHRLAIPDIASALQTDWAELPITVHQVRTFATQQQWEPLTPKPAPRKTQPFDDHPMGFLHVDLIIGPGLGRGTVLLTIRERHSRWADAIPVASKASADVAAGLHQLLARCPVRITTVLTDRGTEFYADFDAYLMTQGIAHRRTKPRTPQTNGMVERLNGLLKHQGPLSDPEWWSYQAGEGLTEGELWAHQREPDRVFPDKRLPRMAHELTRWCAWQNMVRPNRQLGGRSPLAWCVANPDACLPEILQAILTQWVTHPRSMVTDGRKYLHQPPPWWAPPGVGLSGNT